MFVPPTPTSAQVCASNSAMANKTEMHKVGRALVSLSDKSGAENFVRALAQRGIEILSTGGTAAMLRKAGIAAREVSEVTGFPEMMDGRVKTLHPKVHGGLLALRDDAGHAASMSEHGIVGIDLLVINLYPFEATIAKPGVTREEAIENIDIGGPAMVRSAAKNHRFVGVVTDPDDYGRVLDELEKLGGSLSLEFKRELAFKAFAATARYDAAISQWLWRQELDTGRQTSPFPPTLSLAARKISDLRYGENPHQHAAFYRVDGAAEVSVATAEVLGGKTLSFNNLVDLDSALALAKEFDEPFACVIKHNNPCGAAAAQTMVDALERAWSGDALSAFGSVLALTRPLDQACAEFLVAGSRFVEAIIAPSFEPAAVELLTTKPKWGKSVRLLACGPFAPASRRAEDLELKPLVGGMLLQQRNLSSESRAACKVVTRNEPTGVQWDGMLFAAKVGKHVKSNAIVLAQGRQIVGVGAGQMSRVDSVHLALRKAGKRAQGCVLASDAFFPFSDGVTVAMDDGVAALLQPGGSVRDPDVIAACDARGVPMVFSGLRHFRH
jgi:phosphoribosylaminoimidazolecarboxamide formyltransferase / IMP cyclohydrolase